MAAGRYILSRQAVADLEEVADYLGQRNLAAAERVIDELECAFKLLAKNPELGLCCDELRADLRAFVPPRPANNYLIFYYPVSKGVEISDVLHSARDWISLFAKGER